jgi:hypothetical protein
MRILQVVLEEGARRLSNGLRMRVVCMVPEGANEPLPEGAQTGATATSVYTHSPELSSHCNTAPQL